MCMNYLHAKAHYIARAHRLVSTYLSVLILVSLIHEGTMDTIAHTASFESIYFISDRRRRVGDFYDYQRQIK